MSGRGAAARCSGPAAAAGAAVENARGRCVCTWNAKPSAFHAAAGGARPGGVGGCAAAAPCPVGGGDDASRRRRSPPRTSWGQSWSDLTFRVASRVTQISRPRLLIGAERACAAAALAPATAGGGAAASDAPAGRPTHSRRAKTDLRQPREVCSVCAAFWAQVAIAVTISLRVF